MENQTEKQLNEQENTQEEVQVPEQKEFGKALRAEKKPKSKKKKWLIVAASVICLALFGAGSYAYITAQPQAVENTFKPSLVNCNIEGTRNGDIKENMKIRNTSEAEAYVRAEVLVNWVDNSGKVYYEAPVKDVDYTMELDLTNGWIEGSDGFYYYTSPVESYGLTEVLVKTYAPVTEAPEGYKMSVDILASAIQSEPAEEVENVWGVTITDKQLSK